MIYSLFLLLFLCSSVCNGDALTVIDKNATNVPPKTSLLMQVLSDHSAYEQPGKYKQYVCMKSMSSEDSFNVIKNPDDESILLMQVFIHGCRTPNTRIAGWCFKDECQNPTDIQIGIKGNGKYYSVYVLDKPLNNIQVQTAGVKEPNPYSIFNNTLSVTPLKDKKYICRISSLVTSYIGKDFMKYNYLIQYGCIKDVPQQNGLCNVICSDPQPYSITIDTKLNSVEAIPLTVSPTNNEFITFKEIISTSSAYRFLHPDTWMNFGYVCSKTYDSSQVIQIPLKTRTILKYEFQGCRYLSAPSKDGICRIPCKSERFRMFAERTSEKSFIRYLYIESPLLEKKDQALLALEEKATKAMPSGGQKSNTASSSVSAPVPPKPQANTQSGQEQTKESPETIKPPSSEPAAEPQEKGVGGEGAGELPAAKPEVKGVGGEGAGELPAAKPEVKGVGGEGAGENSQPAPNS